ncbi:MAG: indolepyruvate ferredoxin oxidoreductase subunit alpha, partial [Pyramidobacter sp.]|nr:indolepyruvate ferredoxin oxidoreductase subunit alpha [Pyramidobacter sp.]
MKKAVLLGNEAIARGVVEAGCEIACAYPGTPSSEILPAIAKYADELKTNTAVEWGANEKVAFETAVSAAMSGKRSCTVMKQVGLNVAADPFMSTAMFRQNGGFLLIVSDDPGPHSSQTEQDSRMFAYMAQVPCFDPASAQEAKDMVFDVFDLSERFSVTAMLRPTGKIDHARQDVELRDSALPPRRDAQFKKDPSRWVTLPAVVRKNRVRLAGVNEEIRSAFETEYPQYNYEVKAAGTPRLGVIAAGSAFSFLMDLIASGKRDDIDVLKIGTPVPLPIKMCEDFIARHEKTLVLEQTCSVIELQLNDRTKVNGRWNGAVPMTGELLPEVIEKVIAKLLGESLGQENDDDLADALRIMGVADRPPTLCPGCPHRSSFFSIRAAYPNGI